jgi:phosphatidylglycerol:prolipoprotein diacylglycerol transferase
MIPQLFHIGPLPVNSFGLMVALAVFAGIPILASSFRRNGIDPRFAEKYAVAAGVSGFIGARVWYLIVNTHHILEDASYTTSMVEWLSTVAGHVFANAGFIFYGGFVVAAVTLWIMMKRDRILPSLFVDSMGPALALSYAIGRVGCQLSGDGDYGVATSSWVGMSYETGVVPTPPGVRAYPAPFFESIMSVLVFMLLTRIEEKGMLKRPYSRFGLYLAAMSCERFLIEIIRLNPRFSTGISQAQFFALTFLVLGLVLMVWQPLFQRLNRG